MALIDLSKQTRYDSRAGGTVRFISERTLSTGEVIYTTSASVDYTADGRRYPPSDDAKFDPLTLVIPEDAISLEVGKSYLNGYGQHRTIFEVNPDGRYSDDEFTYEKNGRVSSNAHTSKLDLIAEYSSGLSDCGIILKPGHIYWDSKYNDVSISIHPLCEKNTEYTFIGSNGMMYTNEGRIYTNSAISSPLDLIGESDTHFVINDTCYSKYQDPNYIRQEFTLQVDAILDGIPGAFNQEEDLMNWICQNPYVRRVVLTTK